MAGSSNASSLPQRSGVQAIADEKSSLHAQKEQLYYAVAIGKTRGIYNTWAECKEQVGDVPNPKFRKFPTLEEAEEFMEEHLKASFLKNVQKNLKSICPIPAARVQQVRHMSTTTFYNHQFHVSDEGYVQVYTDGACENNGKKGAKAGVGVWFAEGHAL